jgi:hypothetical protein
VALTRAVVLCDEQVGFNAGHSALNWLLYTPPHVRIIAFDIMMAPYVALGAQALRALFGPRCGAAFDP